MRARPPFTPGRLIIALGAGHAGWAAVAYGDELREIAAAGLVDTVGDGIFRRDEDRGARAAAFWFAFVTPMAMLAGGLVERAERAGDGAAVRGAGLAVTAIAALGAAVMPRSGFPAAIPLGVWTYLRGRQLELDGGPPAPGDNGHQRD
jgi:hypothetical protein